MSTDSDKPPRIGRMGVLAYIQSEIAAGWPFPSIEDIAEHFGWHHSSVRDALMGLVAMGHVRVVSRTKSGKGWRYTYAIVEKVEAI